MLKTPWLGQLVQIASAYLCTSTVHLRLECHMLCCESEGFRLFHAPGIGPRPLNQMSSAVIMRSLPSMTLKIIFNQKFLICYSEILLEVLCTMSLQIFVTMATY